jgi:hypothetical protein
MALADREFLTIGPVHDLVQNVVYGLPARMCWIHSTAALEISEDASAWNALTGANTVGAQVGAKFVRCPGGAAIVSLHA